MYIGINLKDISVHPGCTSDVPQMYVRCNPDVHLVFPDFPFILHLSTSGFANVRKCNLHIFAQMYGDVFNRQMYSRCTRNVLEMYISISQNGGFFFWMEMYLNVQKCTQMYI